mmetsp:Transcript_28293/g.79942  ORF Transcript_28293/g.79942 Transcript_28293/m.79942 type:complete len:280 (-) Transcript_28293:473-1312(-)
MTARTAPPPRRSATASSADISSFRDIGPYAPVPASAIASRGTSAAMPVTAAGACSGAYSDACSVSCSGAGTATPAALLQMARLVPAPGAVLPVSAAPSSHRETRAPFRPIPCPSSARRSPGTDSPQLELAAQRLNQPSEASEATGAAMTGSADCTSLSVPLRQATCSESSPGSPGGIRVGRTRTLAPAGSRSFSSAASCCGPPRATAACAGTTSLRDALLDDVPSAACESTKHAASSAIFRVPWMLISRISVPGYTLSPSLNLTVVPVSISSSSAAAPS